MRQGLRYSEKKCDIFISAKRKLVGGKFEFVIIIQIILDVLQTLIDVIIQIDYIELAREKVGENALLGVERVSDRLTMRVDRFRNSGRNKEEREKEREREKCFGLTTPQRLMLVYEHQCVNLSGVIWEGQCSHLSCES